MISLYKIVIGLSNTLGQFKIDTKCHLVNVWSDLDLVKSSDWCNNDNKNMERTQIIFPEMFLHIDVYVQKHLLKNNFCALYVFFCARILRPVCARTA